MRTISLQTGQWRYKVGRSFVRFVDPHGRASYVSAATVAGVTPDAYERGQWKKTSDGSVTPERIRMFLEGAARAEKGAE